MEQLLQTNAKLIEELHARIRATFRERSKGSVQYQAWQAACAELHRRYDGLAFPGGLAQALQKLRAGDMLTAEIAICFLEIHPYFFRSQYIATKLVRLLKKTRLPSHLQPRFDIVWAAARNRKRRP